MTVPEWGGPAYWQQWIEPARAWIETHVFNYANPVQIVAVLAAFAVAWAVARPLDRWLRHVSIAGGWRYRAASVARGVATPFLWLLIVEAEKRVAAELGFPLHVLRIAASLLAAWIVINILVNFVRQPALARLIALTAWTVAALNILSLLDPTIAFLDSLAFDVGDLHLSVLAVITATIIFVVLVWGAIALSNILEHRLARAPGMTPSAQVLFAKLTKIGLVGAAIIIGLNASGIDLTVLAVFGGAVGLGLGFGLQKVVSNLVSGMILLLDRSIKPGDVIEFGDTYGWINTLAARYTSLVTRNGTEYLIPNEDMITQPVINWSHSNRQVRRAIPVGVSYDCDIRKAMDLMTEAGKETERILETPEPRSLLKGFGDSAVDLELRIWIEDPQNGVSNVASEVLLKIWDKFKENDIRIPFPQRDLHVISAPGLADRGSVEH